MANHCNDKKRVAVLNDLRYGGVEKIVVALYNLGYYEEVYTLSKRDNSHGLVTFNIFQLISSFGSKEVHAYSFKSIFFVRIVSLILGSEVKYFEHSIHHGKNKHLIHLFYSFFLRKIFVPSKGLRNHYSRFIKDIEVAPNLIDIGLDRQLEVKPLSAFPKFIFVGRLIELKNLPLIIESFLKYNRGSLDIIGTGNCEFNLREKYKDNRINFRGGMYIDRLIYAKYDILIIASDYESFGNVIVEALLSGIRVIATKSQPGILEIIDDITSNYNNIVYQECLDIETAVKYFQNGEEIYNSLNVERYLPDQVIAFYNENISTDFN